MKTLYFNPFSGISGDMCLGALVDAGCPPDELKAQLAQLHLPGFDLRWERVMRGPIEGTQVHVVVEEEPHAHRTLADVLNLVDQAHFPERVRSQVERVFTALAQAEGRVHGRPHDRIHFHEVGSYDAVVDISGTVHALYLLGVEDCRCSRVHVGEGFVSGTRHGTLPLPAPATAYLLERFDIFSTGLERELVTPTGAALLHGLVGGSTPLPAMRLERVGYGAGGEDRDELPNLLRVFLGETGGEAEMDQVVLIETNIDDMNPQHYEALMESLFAAGALDVSLIPMMMKKNRPAVRLSVMAPLALQEETARIVLRESTAIGVRIQVCDRRVLQRREVIAETPWGPVRGKVCWGHGIEKRVTPEYDDCRRIHQERGVPLAEVYREAMQALSAQP